MIERVADHSKVTGVGFALNKSKVTLNEATIYKEDDIYLAGFSCADDSLTGEFILLKIDFGESINGVNKKEKKLLLDNGKAEKR